MHYIIWLDGLYTQVSAEIRYTCPLKSNSWIFVSFKAPLDKGILEYEAVNNNAFFIYVHNFIWLKDSGALLQHLQSWDIISLSKAEPKPQTIIDLILTASLRTIKKIPGEDIFQYITSAWVDKWHVWSFY